MRSLGNNSDWLLLSGLAHSIQVTAIVAHLKTLAPVSFLAHTYMQLLSSLYKIQRHREPLYLSKYTQVCIG